MITTHLRNLLTAVICIFAGATAQAQQSGTLDLPVSDSKFDSRPVEFSLSSVASSLDTDATTLAGALDAWEMGTNDMFFLADPEDATVLYNDYTQGSKGGFWVLNTGIPAGWGTEGLTWYNTISWDVEEDLFVISIGQYPGVSEVGDVYKPHFVLKFGEKEVGFDVTINFVENTDPVYEIPEPATLIEKELNIVGSAEVTTEQFPRTGYDSDKVTIELPDLAEKLGVEPELIAASMDKLLYTTEYNSGDVEVGGGLKKDSLTNDWSAGEPGFWLHAVQDDQGEETGECSRADYGNEDKFFVEAFAFDAETATLSCNLGQYPSNLKAGEKWYANMYLIYADKAYRVRYNLNIMEREQGSGLEGMNKVGEVSYEFEQIPTSGYEAISFSVDVEAVAAALGCEVGSFSLQGLDDSDNWASSTANNGGFWMNDAGRVVSHSSGAGAMYIEPATSNDYSVLHIGQYPNHFAIDDVWEGELYFVNGDNYYTLKAKMKIVPEEIPDQDKYKIVAVRRANMQLVASSGYAADQTTFVLDPEEIASILGTSSYELYVEVKDEIAEQTGKKYSSYSPYVCDPAPGAWLDADGKGQKWGNDARVGICYSLSNGEFTLFQMPDLNSVGDIFKANLYFVNLEDDNEWPMIQVQFTINFVREIAAYEEVGSEDVTLPVSMEKDCVIDFDLAPAAEALGVTVDELSAESNRYLKGMAGGAYSEGVNIATGLGFDANGDCNSQGDYYFYFEDGKMYTVTSTDIPEDFSLPVQFAFNIDNKIYVYYANFVSEAVYTGIKTVGNEAKADNRIFDISGRQVTKPTRGLYIQNGKKVVIK